MTDESPPIDAATGQPGDGARSTMVAGDRIGAPAQAARRPAAGIVVGGLLGLAAIGGTLWWTLTPPGMRTSGVSAEIPPLAPALPAPPPPPAPPQPAPEEPPVPHAAPPPDPAPSVQPADAKPAADARPAADAKPKPVATTLPPGPPLLPSTGTIADEPLDMVRRRAAAGDTGAMQDLARRYIEGVGVRVDVAEGIGWLQRAAERGAPAAMFNVGVMYERGTVVARDPARALEWYRKASAAGVSMATHNMALMYREGDGVPADYDRAAELLLAASRHGMSASMYALGTMFETGSHGRGKSPVQAIVWYAMALQFQRADPATGDSDLARHAAAKVAALQRTLSDAELRQAQAMGEHEFSLIMTVLRGGDVPAPAVPSTAASAAPAAPVKPPAAPKKPASARERLIDVQKMLLALRIYGGKVDGVKGPKTRAAIRKFQRMAGLPASDETSDEFVQLLREQAQLVDRK